MIGWLTRRFGRSRPYVEAIEERYRPHDERIRLVEETLDQVRRWRRALAGDGSPTGNIVADRLRGLPQRKDKP